MRIATWNVNSVRARLARLLPWLTEQQPEVVCLQETKCLDEQFPREEIEDVGYQVATHGQKTYNGVAILSRRPLEDVATGFGRDAFDGEARVISATVEDVMLVCVYVVPTSSSGCAPCGRRWSSAFPSTRRSSSAAISTSRSTTATSTTPTPGASASCAPRPSARRWRT